MSNWSAQRRQDDTDLVLSKMVDSMLDRTAHRKVGCYPASIHHACNNNSNNRGTGSRGCSTRSARSTRRAPYGSSDGISPCNPKGVGLVMGEGTRHWCQN